MAALPPESRPRSSLRMNANGSDQTPSALWTTWEKVVAAGPTRVAMIDAATGETWTRRELHRLALELSAGRLADVRGRRVALCHPNSAAWVASFLAIQKAGPRPFPSTQASRSRPSNRPPRRPGPTGSTAGTSAS